jgi:membrane associated rhomboid family serine protease
MANAFPPAQAGRPSVAPPESNGDWAAQAADTVERVVGTVRDNTTTRAITAARAVVYGLFAAIVGLVMAILAVILAGRFLNVILPDSVFGEKHMWVVYLIVGLVCVIAGAVVWTQRRPSTGR